MLQLIDFCHCTRARIEGLCIIPSHFRVEDSLTSLRLVLATFLNCTPDIMSQFTMVSQQLQNPLSSCRNAGLDSI